MKTFIYLSTLIWVMNVWAWGPTGHKIVAQIADDQISPKVKLKIQQLLPGQTLADVSNWADSIKDKPEWVHTKPWHYVDLEDGESYEHMNHGPEGDVIVSITDMIATLKNPKSSIEDKQNALKFLVHFVGDIHQPLHVGRPSDRGGNDIRVIFLGKTLNLHSLWDSGMINNQQMDYAQYARQIQSIKTNQPAPYDIREIPFSLIIEENMNARTEIYKFKADSSQGAVILDQAYLQRNLATMNAHLLTGGKRLANILNLVFN